MSSLSKFTKVVYYVRILDEGSNIINTFEYEDEKQAVAEAEARVSYYVESYGVYYEAEIIKKVVPIYL